MKRASGRIALGCLLLNACVPPYEPPRSDQPHAIVKLRRTYETTAGTSLAEAVDIDDHSALRESTNSAVAKAPRTAAILAHPIPGTFSVRSEFSHNELRTVQESYQEPHTNYETETYSCGSGSGTTATYRSCSRSVSRTTYETRWRTVTKTVQVSDGECSHAVRFAPQDRHVYLLQYTYQAPSACALSCFEQIQNADGTFQDQVCPPTPPAKE